MDPLAEQAPAWTPYRYGFNNPLRFIDPTGMIEQSPDGDGRKNNLRRTIVNTFKYDTNSAGNKIEAGTDIITETFIYNTSSRNDLDEPVYTNTVVKISLEVDVKAVIADTATKEVMETITTMTNNGAKAYFQHHNLCYSLFLVPVLSQFKFVFFNFI